VCVYDNGIVIHSCPVHYHPEAAQVQLEPASQGFAHAAKDVNPGDWINADGFFQQETSFDNVSQAPTHLIITKGPGIGLATINVNQQHSQAVACQGASQGRRKASLAFVKRWRDDHDHLGT
jgi:hypothetical protein